MNRCRVLVNGIPREVLVVERGPDGVRFEVGGREYLVELEKRAPAAATSTSKSPRLAPAAQSSAPHSGNEICASLPGVVVEILVSVGARVEQGEVLLRIEAMKMQNSVFAPRAGSVRSIAVAAGDEVGDGQLLLTLE